MEFSENDKQRRHDRKPYSKEITLNDSLKVKAIEISEGGLYVYTKHNFNSEDVVKVSIPFKDENIELKAKVKHIQEGIGFGLDFLEVSDELLSRITELVKDRKH